MRGFSEWLFCPSFIVRVGESCAQYGDPFDYAVVVAVPWKSLFRRYILGDMDAPVVVKALVSQAPTAPITPTHGKTCLREIKVEGFKPTWERFKQVPG